MHKPSRVANSNQNGSTSSLPLTPRIRAQPNSNTLNPNASTTRSRASSGTPAGKVTRRDSGSESISSATSRRSTYIGGEREKQPPSVASSAIGTAGKTVGENSTPRSTRPIGAVESSNGRGTASSMFFRADEISAKVTKGHKLQASVVVSQQTPTSSSKFLHAGGTSTSSTGPNGTGLVRPSRLSSTAATPAPLSPVYTSPIASPSSSTTTSTPIRTHSVKFIYANGTEEVLPPRRKAGSSENDSVPPSPPPSGHPSTCASPIHLKPGLPVSNSSVSLKTLPIATVALNDTLNPQTPIRRASLDAKVRHARALSVGATSSSPEILRISDPPLISPPISDLEGKDENGIPTLSRPILTFQMREELAANARRERKVLDLEISNTSLLAINRTLERQMRKQNLELRRYRRLARTGRLGVTNSASRSKRRRSGSSSMDMPDLEHILDEDDNLDDDLGLEKDREEEMDEDNGASDTSEDEDSNVSDGEGSPSKAKHARGGVAGQLGYKGKRGVVDADKAAIDLSRHQALLDASVKTNASLRRCTLVIEQLIAEGKKALEYRVAPSDVKLGGRVLTDDPESEGDEEATETEAGEEGDENDAEATEPEEEVEMETDLESPKHSNSNSNYETSNYTTEDESEDRTGNSTDDRIIVESLREWKMGSFMGVPANGAGIAKGAVIRKDNKD